APPPLHPQTPRTKLATALHPASRPAGGQTPLFPLHPPAPHSHSPDTTPAASARPSPSPHVPQPLPKSRLPDCVVGLRHIHKARKRLLLLLPPPLQHLAHQPDQVSRPPPSPEE